jgi:aminoglycoside adenylyltransferase-like protein
MGARFPPDVAALTAQLLEAQRRALGDRLLALYLFGSAAAGHFEVGISDVDTVAVLSTDPTQNDLAVLADMHARLIKDAPAWNDRVEVDYLSTTALTNFRTRSWPAARISPGEPFHGILIDQRWLLDWYQVLMSGVTLFGPPPQTFIPPISHEEFIDAVRGLIRELAERLKDDGSLGGRIYAVITACRALRVCCTGEHSSKKEASEWAAAQLPEFQDLIMGALARRYEVRAGAPSSAPPLTETRKFLQAVSKRCADNE